MSFSDLQAAAAAAPPDVADIKTRLPITYVMSVEGIAVEHKGGKAVALCPFHHDTSPSLDLLPDNRFGCFPCGAGGDVLDFIGKFYGLTSFPSVMTKAVELLAGMPADWKAPDLEQRERVEFDQAAASEYVSRCFAAGPAALYGLLHDLSARNPALALVDADWLRSEFVLGSDDERVVAPLMDRSGSVVGYKRRTADTKFFSAAGSTLSGVFYGEWRDTDPDLPVVLCEGETDTWAAAFALRGSHSVLGLSAGAGAHPKNAASLAGRRVTLAFDGDAAGRKATRRWADALRAEGCVVFVAPMPDGADLCSLQDPAAYLRNTRPLLDAPEGLAVEQGVYCRMAKDAAVPISNWSLRPEVESVGPDGSRAYTGTIVPFGGRVTLSSYDLQSKSKTVSWALRQGGAWYGTDRDSQQVLGLLQAEGPFLTPGWMATVAGLHDGHFVFPGGVIGSDNWRYVDPPNTVHLEDRMDIRKGEWVPAQVHALRALHAPHVMDPILAWLALAPLRSLFRQFPVLGVMGSSGSGKTTLLETVLHHFTGTQITTNLTSTTPHALFSFVGSSNAFPVWFDEYRPGARKATKESLDQVIRDAYTGQASSKGGMGSDSWAEVTTVPAMCPLVVTGEDAFSETSHTERMTLIYLPLMGRSPRVLDDIRSWGAHGLPHAYLTWLHYTLSTDALDLTVTPSEVRELPSRQRYNLGLLALGWRVLDEFVTMHGGNSLGTPKFDPMTSDALSAAGSSPIKDALLWCLEESQADFIRLTDDGLAVAVRVENFVQFVSHRGQFTLPGGAEAIRRYLADHYGAVQERVRFSGVQARAHVFPAKEVGL